MTRRIDREQGSTYRVNGKEVRARDVQLLFADASTGSNSPALVRQGQISELIAAKPQNRRRILEEAGGVAGLHNRRHEAELRLRGAETNLARLDDVTRELETNYNRLRREARQAERYKKISGEIRALQGAVLYGRWLDAKSALERAREELTETTNAVEATASAAAHAQTEAINAAEALKPLREEDAVAAAVLHRLTLERDRLEGEERQARAEVERLEGELMRIDTDSDREARAMSKTPASNSRACRRKSLRWKPRSPARRSADRSWKPPSPPPKPSAPTPRPRWNASPAPWPPTAPAPKPPQRVGAKPKRVCRARNRAWNRPAPNARPWGRWKIRRSTPRVRP